MSPEPDGPNGRTVVDRLPHRCEEAASGTSAVHERGTTPVARARPRPGTPRVGDRAIGPARPRGRAARRDGGGRAGPGRGRRPPWAPGAAAVIGEGVLRVSPARGSCVGRPRGR